MILGTRARFFLENFFVYGLTGVLGKIIPVLMLPVVTRLIPDASVYGVADLLRIIVSFASAFAVLGMYDAMFRVFFDEESTEFKKRVCSTAIIVVAVSSLCVGGLIMLFSGFISEAIFSSGTLQPWVCLMGFQTILSGFDSIISAPTRMQNQRRVFVVMSVLLPVISYSVSIPLIVFVNPLLGLVIGGFTSAAAKVLVFGWLNKNWFSPYLFDGRLAKEMLKIGVPIVPAFFVYWLYNSADRIMITSILGTEQTGVYAVGARMAQISQFIYTAFAGGWQYFAFSTMKDKDHTLLMSRIFEALGTLSVVAFFILLPWVEPLFLLVGQTYRPATVVFPYLFISPLLLMLFQTVGNQFLVMKKAYLSVLALTLGAITNIALNALLIPRMGIEGAALATVLGYLTSVALAFVLVRNKGMIYGNWRELVVFGIAVLGFLICRMIPDISEVYVSTISIAIIGGIYFLKLIVYKND
jgi:O-antigen/teichoic acid export membrane protein